MKNPKEIIPRKWNQMFWGSSMKKSILTFCLIMAIFAATGGSVFAAESESKTLDLKTYGKSGYVSLTDSNYEGMPLPANLIGNQLFIQGSNSVGLVEFWRVDDDLNESVFVKEEIPVVVHLGKNAGIEIEGKPLRVEGVVKEQLLKGFYPVRQVFELAGYMVRYDAQTHQVKLSK